MKIALTGANGFLGSHIARVFIEDGHEVIALVRPSADCSTLPESNQLHLEPIDYREDLTPAFQSIQEKHQKIDAFIHNAGVTVSLDNQEYFKINTDLTGKIVGAVDSTEFIQESGKIVYVSSLTAQGPAGINKPVSKYGESKLAAEEFFKDSKYPHLIIRPTAIYGAGDYAFLPLLKGANSRVYPLTNKKQKMSMIHGKDLANMILQETKKSEGILHASDGNTYLHEDFVVALQNVVGKKIIKIPVPTGVSKAVLGFSDIWHKMINKRPGLTREKFQEISMDWDLHEDSSLKFSQVKCEISLEEGFRDAFNYYKSKKLI